MDNDDVSFVASPPLPDYSRVHVINFGSLVLLTRCDIGMYLHALSQVIGKGLFRQFCHAFDMTSFLQIMQMYHHYYA